MAEAVVGVGNPLVGDDGVGAAVVERVASEIDGTVRHAGTNAFLALEAMTGADRAVLVDAVSVAEPPGTVVRLPFDGTSFPRGVEVTMHDFSVTQAFRAGSAAYDLPSSVWLVGVVPASLAPGTELSPTVRERVPAAAECVRKVLTDRPAEAATNRPTTDYATATGEHTE
jgi:hydrogenase maturation protease